MEKWHNVNQARFKKARITPDSHYAISIRERYNRRVVLVDNR